MLLEWMSCNRTSDYSFFFFSIITSDDSSYAHFEEADPTAGVGTSEMLVVIKVYVTQEPGVGKFLTSAIKPLIATQMPSCVE